MKSTLRALLLVSIVVLNPACTSLPAGKAPAAAPVVPAEPEYDAETAATEE